MTSKTKIVVLRLKDLIYTGLLVLFGILFLVLMIAMFVPKSNKSGGKAESPAATYIPGIYTTSLIIGDNVVDVEVTVDETTINDIRLVNLNEVVTTMFPLIEPSFDSLAGQILGSQSLDHITYSDDNKYTSMILFNAIKASVEKAVVPATE